MKKLIAAILILAATDALAGAWPTDNISMTKINDANADPGQTRPDIATTMQRVKDIIAALASANGVASLDGSAHIPTSQLPTQLQTWNGKSAPTGAVVGTTDTQTLTNKTLTSPIVSGGSVNNATVGTTTAAAGAFTTLQASSTFTAAAGITQSAACQTGYTRTAAGFCRANTPYASRFNLSNGTCSTVTFPSGSTAIWVQCNATAKAIGATGIRSAAVYAYSDSCSTIYTFVAQAEGYEPSSMTLGNEVAASSGSAVIPNNSSYRMTLTNGGISGSAYCMTMGYWTN